MAHVFDDEDDMQQAVERQKLKLMSVLDPDDFAQIVRGETVAAVMDALHARGWLLEDMVPLLDQITVRMEDDTMVTTWPEELAKELQVDG